MRTATKPVSEPIQVPISAGELVDKITILEIKSQQMSDESKLTNVRRELAMLHEVHRQQVESSGELDRMTDELRQINAQLWDIEDDIRRCEAEGDFGQRFIALARAVYCTNDERARVKREINLLVSSPLVEEKNYRPYGK